LGFNTVADNMGLSAFVWLLLSRLSKVINLGVMRKPFLLFIDSRPNLRRIFYHFRDISV